MLEYLARLSKIKAPEEILTKFIEMTNQHFGHEVVKYVENVEGVDNWIPLVYDDMSFGFLKMSKQSLSDKDCEHLASSVSIVCNFLFNSYKRSEKDVSTYYFQSLINAIPNPVFLKDKNFRYIGCNATFEKKFGFTTQDIEGKTVWSMFDENIAEICSQKDKELLENLKTQTYELTHTNKDDEVKHLRFDTAVFYFEDGAPGGIVGTIIDVTEKNEQQLNFKKLSKAVDQSPVSIVITDVEGKIEYVNPKVVEVTGYSKEFLLGRNPKIFQSGKTKVKVYQHMWSSLLAGKTWRGELLNKKKNGELFWELNIISPITDRNKNITHFVAVKEDVTKQKRILKELKNSRDEAEKASKLKTEFLAQMSHEIRTPINTLLSLAQLIKNESEEYLENDVKQCFPAMKRAGQRIIRTIDLILNLSQVQVGSVDINPVDIDAKAYFADKLMPEFIHKAKEKGIKLDMDVQTSYTELICDENMFDQIFVNLIENAIKYTDEGTIDIKIFRNSENKLVISVIDTGIGIKEEFLPIIFKEFSQEEQGYTRSFEGNGLGLSLVQKYCSVNNAQIEVESEKGKGSTFSVTFGNS